MATHSSVLAWRIPGTGEPGGSPSMGSHSRTRLNQLSSSSRVRLPQLPSSCLEILSQLSLSFFSPNLEKKSPFLWSPFTVTLTSAALPSSLSFPTTVTLVSQDCVSRVWNCTGWGRIAQRAWVSHLNPASVSPPTRWRLTMHIS